MVAKVIDFFQNEDKIVPAHLDVYSRLGDRSENRSPNPVLQYAQVSYAAQLGRNTDNSSIEQSFHNSRVDVFGRTRPHHNFQERHWDFLGFFLRSGGISTVGAQGTLKLLP